MTDTLQTRKHKQIGGLWLGKTRGGDTALSGEITLSDGTKQTVFVWKNPYKNENNRQPDYKIWIPEEIPDDGFPKEDAF